MACLELARLTRLAANSQVSSFLCLPGVGIKGVHGIVSQVWWCLPLISVRGKLERAELCEVKVGLVYIMNSRTVRTTE